MGALESLGDASVSGVFFYNSVLGEPHNKRDVKMGFFKPNIERMKSKSDVKGLIKSSIRDDDPVIFFQHKRLFAQTGPVPEEEYLIPIGSGDVKREGADITILTYSRMTYLCLEAADQAAGSGMDAEVVDLRTLKPLDFDLISESVKKTNNVLIVHEACLTGGFGAEIAARIGEELFDYLEAPVTRIGAKDVPIPFSPVMEAFVLPQVNDIVEGMKKVLNR